MYNRYIRNNSRNIILVIVASIVFMAGMWQQLINDTGDLNLHVHQAHAFLHGQTSIAPQEYDAAVYEGKFYVPYPPVPSILLLPFVAVFGIGGTKVLLISLLLTVLNVFVLRSALLRLGLDNKLLPWVLFAFFMGTAYWMVARYTSTVYYFAHIVSMTALLLAVNEAFGKKRGWLIGLFLGMAILSRQLMVYSTLFFMTVLWQHYREQGWRKTIQQFAGFFTVLAVFFFSYLWYNWLRFGSPLDSGYSHIDFTPFLKMRIDKYGLFNIVYVPFNFIYLFLQGFHVNFSQPLLLRLVDVDHFGTSITFASPFFFAAFFAKGDKAIIRAAWVSIALTVVHLLLYHNNGWFQINAQRFTLDFMPLLIVLTALGVKRIQSKIFKGAVIYAVALNILALILIPLAALVLEKLV